MKSKKEKPPALAAWILSRIARAEKRLSIVSDFSEIYEELAIEEGWLKARQWYWIQVLRSIPMFIINHFYWRAEMFKNYLKIALRNMVRNKIFSLINIAGLAIGMTLSILLFLFVRYEYSYDKYHPNADKIYRVADGEYSKTAANLAGALKQEFPEVKYAARVFKREVFFRYKQNFINDIEIHFVDPEFFKIFNFPLISGFLPDPMEEPFSLLLTEQVAEKCFGSQDPIGQTINLNNKYDFVVRGVLQNIPENSHMKLGCLTPMNTLQALLGKKYLNRWGSHDFWTYIQISDNVRSVQLERKFSQLEKNT